MHLTYYVHFTSGKLVEYRSSFGPWHTHKGEDRKKKQRQRINRQGVSECMLILHQKAPKATCSSFNKIYCIKYICIVIASCTRISCSNSMNWQLNCRFIEEGTKYCDQTLYHIRAVHVLAILYKNILSFPNVQIPPLKHHHRWLILSQYLCDVPLI